MFKKAMAAAFTLNAIALVILFCGSAVGTRTNLFSVKGQAGMDARSPAFSPALSPAAEDGMCNTLVKTKGYACEEHIVTTHDGYILSMQRIPEGRSGGLAGNKPPVLLQHGLLVHGAIWLLLPPDQALPFVLADNGFDVWIANSRGTKYSKGHTSLSPDSEDYWQWSWDELVAYDLSAMFRYVCDQTGQKMHYVGHSQGTLMALAALSKNELLEMWRSASLLAPISYLDNINSQLVRFVAKKVMANESYWLGVGEFDMKRSPTSELLWEACNQPDVNCTYFLSAISGNDCCLNESAAQALLNPQPTATKNMIHLAQMIAEGTIEMYDYNDKDDNQKHYGQPTPPVYDLKHIPNDFPLFLSHGGVDTLSDAKDVQHLLDSLKCHVSNKLVTQYIEKYAHNDFMVAVNAKENVYDPLLAFLRLH